MNSQAQAVSLAAPKLVPFGPISIAATPKNGPRIYCHLKFTLMSDTPKEKIDKLTIAARECIERTESIVDWNYRLHLNKRGTKDWEDKVWLPLQRFALTLELPRFLFEVDAIRPANAISLGWQTDGGIIPSQDEAVHHLPDSARNRHVYIAGKTRSGKSTHIFNLAFQDIAGEKGVAVIDPHGDLVEKLVDQIPERRKDDVVYLDAENAVPIDLMSYGNEREKEALVGDTIFLLQRFAGWGPRMDAILHDLLYTLLDAGDVSFLDIYHFLANEKRRSEILKRVKDEDLVRRWRDSFPRPDAIEPIISRMTTFVRSPSLSVFMGSPKPKLNIYDLMQQKKVLLVNLTKSGRESGDLLGSLIVSKIQQCAMRRPAEERTPFYLYTDEFQRFQTSSFEVILSEAGKFNLALVMANQYIDQLDSEVLSSIIGNVSTLFLFRMEAQDAKHFASSISLNRSPEDFRDALTRGADLQTALYGPMEANRLADLPVGTCLYKPVSGMPVFLHFGEFDSPVAGSAQYIKKRTVDKYSCNTGTPVVQLGHGASAGTTSPTAKTTDDDIAPSGRPDIPPHED
jgi:hypothetical protein